MIDPDLAECQALIMAPTRELAMQVRKELEWLYAAVGDVCLECVTGGTSLWRDLRLAQFG